jgi:Retroviral aspartyl protease
LRRPLESGETSEGQPNIAKVLTPVHIPGTISIKPEDHFVINVQLRISPHQVVSTTALVDSGATSNFISASFVQENNLSLEQKKIPVPVNVIDGRPISSGHITHHTSVILQAGPHLETIQFDVTCLGESPVILGIPWLRTHNPHLNWKRNTIEFNSDYCSKTCILSPPLVPAVTIEGYRQRKWLSGPIGGETGTENRTEVIVVGKYLEILNYLDSNYSYYKYYNILI